MSSAGHEEVRTSSKRGLGWKRRWRENEVTAVFIPVSARWDLNSVPGRGDARGEERTQ